MTLDKLRQLGDKLSGNNPYVLFREYLDIFNKNSNDLPKRNIKKNDEYFRARVGCMSTYGGIDDLDIEIEIPYFGKSIGVAPPLLSKGGRFNREGTSFLYLGTDSKTCIAELRSEVNQVSSVAKFICLKDLEMLDLTVDNENDFLYLFKKLMLEPVHSGIRHKYLVSQFLSDIIREMGFHGIVYSSTVSFGENLVCFHPENFKCVDFSEKMFIVKKVKYVIDEVPDSYKKYKEYQNLLSSYNESEENRKDELFKYINDKIIYDSRMDIENYKVIANEKKSFEEKKMILDEMVEKHKGDMVLSSEVFIARGNFYCDNKMIKEAISDYYDSKRWKKNLLSDDEVAECIHGYLMESEINFNMDEPKLKDDIRDEIKKKRKNWS